MKPLSPLKFFAENKKRSATILIILFMAVAVVSFITSIVSSIIIDATKANLDSYKSMSLISSVSNDIFLKDEIVEEVDNIPEIEYIFNVNFSNTYLSSMFGSTSSSVFYPNNLEDTKVMMEKLGLVLAEGRLPGNEGYEIIMHEQLLQNKNLSIGDYIGNDVNDNEWLPGKTKIVGSIKGDLVISLANRSIRMEALENSGVSLDKPVAQVLIPKEGQLDQMNEKIEQFDKKKVSYMTYSSLKRSFDQQIESMKMILTIVIFVVVFIVSISIGALIYIVYMDRSDEFGILYAMGYRKSFIKNLIFRELITLSIVSWIGGYLFSWGVLSVLNYFVLTPKGQSLYFFTTLGLMNTLIIPIMVTICATYPILKKLKKWDPIAVIERRD